ncbi:protein of unknown function [Paraburkholderia dioscoreae]|uniref:Uncharacterized protein n=1 Tax=Paraburkholderia dioscoreae TaxID=2604047 RepID=A0A5Q4ZDJ8_9BURK|nr:protein of unknown function [Paraburkholderia dioscoreae]
MAPPYRSRVISTRLSRLLFGFERHRPIAHGRLAHTGGMSRMGYTVLFASCSCDTDSHGPA